MVKQQTQTNPLISKSTVTAAQVANVPANAKFAGVAGVCAICGKPLLGKASANGMGTTCIAHIGKVGLNYKQAPAGVTLANNPQYVPLTQLCNHAQTLGRSRGFAVMLTGGNAGVKPPLQPIFAIYTQGGRKYVQAGAIQALTALATGKATQPA
jgi:hypothetical protein